MQVRWSDRPIRGYLQSLRSQFQFKGKLRAILKPLIPKPPLIGGVSVFLLDEPTIDFDLTGLGELVELPGLLYVDCGFLLVLQLYPTANVSEVPSAASSTVK